MKRIDWRRWSKIFTILLGCVAVGIAAHLLGQFSWVQVSASLARIHPQAWLCACLSAAASYLTLTGFDWLGVRYAKGEIPYPKVALASFMSLSIGHTVGFAPFSSGTIRYRYYSEAGLSVKQIGLVILLSAVTVVLGEITLSGVALVARPTLAKQVLHLGDVTMLAIGLACLAVPAAYWIAATMWRRELKIRSWTFRWPGARIAGLQIALGLVNFAFAAGTLYWLLASAAPIDFRNVATAYVVANLAALVTQSPGGLGVLEVVVLKLLPGVDALGPLIAFRIVYFLLPLSIGCVLFIGGELRHRLGGPVQAKLRP